MSLVLYGGGVIDNRGSISGNTFSRSKFGATIRAKTSPVNIQNHKTTKNRALLQSVSGIWSSTLSETERQQWNAFALLNPQTNVFGQISYLSGAQWFTKCAINSTNVGGPIQTTPPVSGSMQPPMTVSVTASHGSPGTVVVTWTEPTLGLTDLFVLWATPNLSPGISFVKNKLRQIGYITHSSSPHDFQADWHSAFEGVPLLQGQKIFVLGYNQTEDTGITSAGIIASCIVS